MSNKPDEFAINLRHERYTQVLTIDLIVGDKWRSVSFGHELTDSEMSLYFKLQKMVEELDKDMKHQLRETELEGK